MPSKLWDNIIYSYPNTNGSNVKGWEWISIFIPNFIMGIIAYPWWDLGQTMLVQGAPCEMDHFLKSLTRRGRNRMATILHTEFPKSNSWLEIWIHISPKFVPTYSFNKNIRLIEIMASHPIGDKPLSVTKEGLVCWRLYGSFALASPIAFSTNTKGIN